MVPKSSYVCKKCLNRDFDFFLRTFWNESAVWRFNSSSTKNAKICPKCFSMDILEIPSRSDCLLTTVEKVKSGWQVIMLLGTFRSNLSNQVNPELSWPCNFSLRRCWQKIPWRFPSTPSSTTGCRTRPCRWPTSRTLTTRQDSWPRRRSETFLVPKTFTKSSVIERASLAQCR